MGVREVNEASLWRRLESREVALLQQHNAGLLI